MRHELKLADTPTNAIENVIEYNFYIIKFKLIGHTEQSWIHASPKDLRVKEQILEINNSRVPIDLIEKISIRYNLNDKKDINEYCKIKTEVEIKVSREYLSKLLELSIQDKLLRLLDSKSVNKLEHKY